MKLSNGIDMVEIKRIEKSLESKRFIDMVYSSEEQELLKERNFRAETAAANFCAKEAFSKALGTGVRGFSLNEVSVLRDSMGAPYLKLTGSALKLAGNKIFSVSLTHTKDTAAAFVTAVEP